MTRNDYNCVNKFYRSQIQSEISLELFWSFYCNSLSSHLTCLALYMVVHWMTRIHYDSREESNCTVSPLTTAVPRRACLQLSAGMHLVDISLGNCQECDDRTKIVEKNIYNIRPYWFQLRPVVAVCSFAVCSVATNCNQYLVPSVLQPEQLRDCGFSI